MIIIINYDRVVTYTCTDDFLMQKRTDIMRNSQMSEVTSKRAKIGKVTLTKKLEQTEKQIIVTQGQTTQTSLAEGKFLSYQYNELIFIHGGRCIELVDTKIISTAHASVLITILLEGKLSFGYDDLEFDLDATHQPQGVVVNLTKPANFRRVMTASNKLNKINILVKPKWFESRVTEECKCRNFINTHNANFQLEVTEEIWKLTQELTTCSSPNNFHQKLHIESLTQQILENSMHQLPQTCCLGYQTKPKIIKPATLATNIEHQSYDERIEAVICFIEIHLDQELSLKMLAEHFSMSVSNIQRRFKQSYNMTINGYIRLRRLEIARQHLERGLVSITEAAYEAGYQHPSNFTNAFKKTFGVPPQDIAIKT
ncbi:helix-turn-helix domain-containing protein [Vibrio tasmaniensis]|uniref:helix-turn-helix domain-containing protein n=1 Tax=Vibrio tasmaniensis TaxID=212663 RepID=UPI0011182D84|nr:AraC family transcriptional regulator [Vibrio tasmaniensis]